MINKTQIKITGAPTGDVPLKIVLQKFCLLRAASEIGHIETVNNTQLGRLRDQGVQFLIKIYHVYEIYNIHLQYEPKTNN